MRDKFDIFCVSLQHNALLKLIKISGIFYAIHFYTDFRITRVPKRDSCNARNISRQFFFSILLHIALHVFELQRGNFSYSYNA